jgi:hypothetical protein
VSGQQRDAEASRGPSQPRQRPPDEDRLAQRLGHAHAWNIGTRRGTTGLSTSATPLMMRLSVSVDAGGHVSTQSAGEVLAF